MASTCIMHQSMWRPGRRMDRPSCGCWNRRPFILEPQQWVMVGWQNLADSPGSTVVKQLISESPGHGHVLIRIPRVAHSLPPSVSYRLVHNMRMHWNWIDNGNITMKSFVRGTENCIDWSDKAHYKLLWYRSLGLWSCGCNQVFELGKSAHPISPAVGHIWVFHLKVKNPIILKASDMHYLMCFLEILIRTFKYIEYILFSDFWAKLLTQIVC